jgi:uncharacterized damage-inducible protein DinB
MPLPRIDRLSSVALVAFALTASGDVACAQQPTHPTTAAAVLDAQLLSVESQFLPAAESMPADKYGFAPSAGDFQGVRTFALEVKHVATANFVIYSAILGQDPPPGVTAAGAGNGPASIQTRDQILQYLKDSFALGHRALATITEQNLLVPVSQTPIPSVNTRLALATFVLAHTSDHYGQMVEYLRMNGIVPPASKGQPPANPRAD